VSGVAWFCLAWVYSAVLSWIALRKRDWLSIPWVKPLGLLGFLVLAVFMIQGFRGNSSGAYGTAFFLGVGSLVLAITFAPFMVFLIAESFDIFHRWGSGIDSMRVEKSYDLAEKRQYEGDWEGALALYRDEVQRDGKDVEVRRRAGEAARKLGRRDESIRWFRDAIRISGKEETAVTLSFRLSELLLEEAVDREEGVRLLEKISREKVGTNFEKYARERLERIREGT